MSLYYPLSGKTRRVGIIGVDSFNVSFFSPEVISSKSSLVSKPLIHLIYANWEQWQLGAMSMPAIVTRTRFV